MTNRQLEAAAELAENEVQRQHEAEQEYSEAQQRLIGQYSAKIEQAADDMPFPSDALTLGMIRQALVKTADADEQIRGLSDNIGNRVNVIEDTEHTLARMVMESKLGIEMPEGELATQKATLAAVYLQDGLAADQARADALVSELETTALRAAGQLQRETEKAKPMARASSAS
jgi:hypothetical protein